MAMAVEVMAVEAMIEMANPLPWWRRNHGRLWLPTMKLKMEFVREEERKDFGIGGWDYEC
ncbi:hypothetical protein Csa_022137 [Cucumis sativus]|uniref:Uncharacterized protein n=1 Tax=Cucumis sativus TaxID=3659 RepID=A0A0A0LLK4_CUCSA|nr:hypothetical protein Csa_022137 [Cucumis sativus]